MAGDSSGPHQHITDAPVACFATAVHIAEILAYAADAEFHSIAG
jgi:hypothetical protein